MKKMVLVLTLLMTGCNENNSETKWQGRCFPNKYLSEASFINSNKGDNALDKELSKAPILFFPANYVVQHIKKFQPVDYQNDESPLNNFISVNLLPHRKLERNVNASFFNTFSDAKDLYIPVEHEKYSFTLYTKSENTFLYWGSCEYSAVDNYSCFRDIEFENMNISYLVNQDNISIHKKIDDFIIEHLNNFQCE